MSTNSKLLEKKSSRTTLTVGKVERDTGVKFGVPADTPLKKYFTDSGVAGLARILEKIESSETTVK